MYRHQRHIYDLTRKFYLLGRDGLLAALPSEPGMAICEMGTGTGRNLIRLASRSRATRLYGIDISRAMLATADSAIQRAGLAKRVQLAESNIESFDPQRCFGVAQFDVVYFSYVLSMLPEWRPAVNRAIEVLRPGGTLAVVDFADQAEASPLRRRILLAWLALFDVHPRSEIESELVTLARSFDKAPQQRSLGRGYAYQLIFRKAI
ncbi:MAG TPA: class I SAM-dependent methyltransferase [Stellaceae bacterium]|nr:class I SAM-dependent methyltransferase [Stellaceae bacterium]